MAQTVYEGMFLLDSNRYGRDPEGVAAQIPKMIRKAGGEVLVSRLWEERRLAYPIKGRRKGAYWLTYFRLDGQKLADLNRQSQLNDSILRVLFIKIDPRIVDTVVEHAQAGTAKPVGAAAEKAPEEKKAAESAQSAAATELPGGEEAAAAKAEEAEQPAPEKQAD